MVRTSILILSVWMVTLSTANALERPGVEFKIFQFPRNMMPSIDGDTKDWDIVPKEYAIGLDQLVDTTYGMKTDPKDKDVTVRIGWVKGMNRLYFLYEAYDDYWDFDSSGIDNDIFELVVDGDLSGGPLITEFHPADSLLTKWERYARFHGVHAQNYHIFTPAENKSWTMVWGCQPWIYEFPYANAAYSYNFKHGESGKLVLEFWITPFDYAPIESPSRAVESKLTENSIIGVSWSILEYDGVHDSGRYKAFWNLSHKTTMYGNASDLCAFRLMPLEKRFRKPIEAQWSFVIADMDRRVVAFKDESYGTVTSWEWDFGDGVKSSEQNPVHIYEKEGRYTVVVLTVKGPDGTSQLAKVWDVAVK
ncbi:PKD domain-containing protein [bacterium]|nr:PKD domain-containing protein [bacterium]